MAKIKVLITGANSYIGTSFENYAKEHYDENFMIDTIDMKDGSWKDFDFSKYDTIFHVAGIAHADVGNVSEETKKLYYRVNTDLAIDTAKKAKEQGVKQFVYMSSLIVYGESAPYGKERIITKETEPEPANFYGDSKWQADKGVRELETKNFKVLVLRPPMIYGKGSKGNYPVLAKLAKKLPIFPNVKNERSMLYIENLCEFLCQVMIKEKSGVYFPQNAEYTRTVSMAEEIRKTQGKKLIKLSILNPFVKLGTFIPGKISGLINKAFGNMTIDQELSKYEGINYQKVSLKESIMKTEKVKEFGVWKNNAELEKYSVLMSVYKKEKGDFLIQSIESMLNQTVLCDQFVLVEDGPLTNELQEIIDDYETEYKDIFTVVKLPENIGLGKALDKGIEYCKNDLIARMDSDDISKPERCEKLLKLFRDNENLSLAGTNIDEFYDEPSNIVSSRIVPSDYDSIYKFMKRRSPFNHPTVMYRKCEVLRVGGYGNMRRKQDLDLFARMINQSCYALNINESLLLFRSNEDNFKRRKSWEYCRSYIEVEYANYKRGYCSFKDLMVVCVGQLVMLCSPMWLTKILSNKLLRNQK